MRFLGLNGLNLDYFNLGISLILVLLKDVEGNSGVGNVCW